MRPSQDGYATNVYVVSTNKNDGSKAAQLAFCKAKVTPVTKVGKKVGEEVDLTLFSICRLELLGMAVTVVAANYVRKALRPEIDPKTVQYGDVASHPQRPIQVFCVGR